MSRRPRDERDRAAMRPLDSTFRNVRRAVVVLAAALAMMVFPSSSFGAAKGLETDISWGVPSSDQSQDVAAMRDLGVSWTRLTLSWHDAQPKRGSLSSRYLSSFDTALQLARSTGANVIVDVYQSPQWASGSGDKDAPPVSGADFKTFMSSMAQRYKGQAAAWEIWNEENHPRYWGGSPNPAAYADLLKNGYTAVKSVDPGAQVVFGGLSTNDWQYLESAYAASPDLGNYYDVMAVHPYSPIWSPDLVRYDGSGHIERDSFAGYREIRRVMLGHANDKPMYFTELGWSTTSQSGMGVSPEQQAWFTNLAWRCMQQDPYVQVGILYALRNNYWANDADNWEDQLGLATTGWSHKPAYDAFKGIDPNYGDCTYRDGNGTALGAGTQPVRASATAPTSASSSSSGSRQATKAPTIVLRIKTDSRPRSAGAVKRLKSGVRFSVFGRVVGAKGGRVALTFQRRAHGVWRKSASKALAVRGDGTFKSQRLKALERGGWRVQASYAPSPAPAKSRFVYFKV